MSEQNTPPMWVEFFYNPVVDADCIRYHFKDDKTCVPEFIADEHYRKKHWQEWEAYSRATDVLEGQTSLYSVAWIDEGTRYLLQANNIRSVEQLAALTDTQCRNLIEDASLETMRNRAREAVETKNKVELVDDQDKRIKDLERELAKLKKAA